MYTIYHRFRRQTTLHCSLCGEEIVFDQEYWSCNGSCICEACLPDFARQEFLPCRERRGEEGRL